jgi:hypothetical protein
MDKRSDLIKIELIMNNPAVSSGVSKKIKYFSAVSCGESDQK